MKNNEIDISSYPLRCIQFVLIFILTLNSSCSSLNKRSYEGDASRSEQEKLDSSNQNFESSVTLDYELGRDHYLFQVTAHGDSIQAKSTKDKHLLKQNAVPRSKYLSFLNKAGIFLKAPRNPSRKAFNCRGPYIVTVKTGASTQVTRGCRSDNDCSIGRLIREGEFLLYSEN